MRAALDKLGMDFGRARSIQLALVTSGRIQSEVDLLALHAAGNVEGDRIEARAVRMIFGAATRHHMYTPALKSHLGHALAASGPLALAVVLEAMHRQQLPGPRNLVREAPEVALAATPRGPRADTLRVAMVNATGWAHNATLAICHPASMRPIPVSFEAAGDVLAVPDADSTP